MEHSVWIWEQASPGSIGGHSFGTSSWILGEGWVSLSPAEPPGHGKAPLRHVYKEPLSRCACPNRSTDPPPLSSSAWDQG